MPISSGQSDNTCGVACWMAKEPECRCSCNSKNHGCMLTKDGTRPDRIVKIDGYPYKLTAVAVDGIWSQAQAINIAAGEYTNQWGYKVHWYHSDKGAPARVKMATVAQCNKWHELTAWKDIPHYQSRPSLLWIRVDHESPKEAL